MSGLVAVALASATIAAPVNVKSTSLPFTVFVSNEATTRASPYHFDLEWVETVADMSSAVVYGPLGFDSSYAITSSNENDATTNYAALMTLKNVNSNLKVLFCVGGPKFPSSSWSAMAASADNRATFIASVQTMQSTYGFDGVEIHWDAPGSAAKSIWLGSAASGYTELADGGGSAADLYNLATLLSEMRSTLGDSFVITLALGRDSSVWASGLSTIDNSVDMYYVHAYDYRKAADTNGNGADVTTAATPVLASEYGSVSATLSAYVQAGITSAKMTAVAAAHGQAFHLPDAPRDGWAQFGLSTTVTGACGGPYADSHGAYPSVVTGACGELTIAEILMNVADTTSSVPTPVFDSTTGSDIAFLPKNQTWISYTGASAAQTLVQAVQQNNGGGVAINTLDMDVIYGGPSFTLTVALCEAFYGQYDTRCVLPTTTPPTTTGRADDCSNGASGIFCLADGSGFIFCPQGITEYCPSGTVCKPLGDDNVMCDWPDNDWSSSETHAQS
eukprot:m.439224 g.439224  ORF g.439224 m.439224 type:complete len:504 (-) comp18356_c0_seq1:90-1601(-)